MAVILITEPNPKIYTRTLLHALGRADSDSEFRTNLRLVVAVLLAYWADTKPDLSGVRGDIFDVVTSEHFYRKGLAKTVYREKKGPLLNDDGIGIDPVPMWKEELADETARLWFCSYVGFEKITSKWAKENHPGCHGYICMRVFNQDVRHNEIDGHTIIVYF